MRSRLIFGSVMTDEPMYDADFSQYEELRQQVLEQYIDILNEGRGDDVRTDPEGIAVALIAFHDVPEEVAFALGESIADSLENLMPQQYVRSSLVFGQQETITDGKTTVKKRDPSKQVNDKNKEDFFNLLDQEGIEYEYIAIPVGEIIPEQKEIKREKVDSIKDGLRDGDELKACYVDKDNHMVDGHHRMVAFEELNGEDGLLPCVRIDAPAKKVFKLMEDSNMA